MAHNSELTVKRIASLALMSDIDPASSCTVRAGVVGSMATQFARGAGYVIGTGRAPGRQTALDFGAQEFVDIGNDAEVGGVSGFRCPRRRHPEAVRRLASRRRNAGDPCRPDRGAALWRPDCRLVVVPDRTQFGELVRRGPGWSAAERRSCAFIREDSGIA
jgi:hypothetical protein